MLPLTIQEHARTRDLIVDCSCCRRHCHWIVIMRECTVPSSSPAKVKVKQTSPNHNLLDQFSWPRASRSSVQLQSGRVLFGQSAAATVYDRRAKVHTSHFVTGFGSGSKSTTHQHTTLLEESCRDGMYCSFDNFIRDSSHHTSFRFLQGRN